MFTLTTLNRLTGYAQEASLRVTTTAPDTGYAEPGMGGLDGSLDLDLRLHHLRRLTTHHRLRQMNRLH